MIAPTTLKVNFDWPGRFDTRINVCWNLGCVFRMWNENGICPPIYLSGKKIKIVTQTTPTRSRYYRMNTLSLHTWKSSMERIHHGLFGNSINILSFPIIWQDQGSCLSSRCFTMMTEIWAAGFCTFLTSFQHPFELPTTVSNNLSVFVIFQSYRENRKPTPHTCQTIPVFELKVCLWWSSVECSLSASTNGSSAWASSLSRG